MAAWCCVAGARAQATGDALEQVFKAPPDDARPMVRWWWFGPAVVKPELERELQQMHDAGFGGFEIQPVYPLELDDAAKTLKNLPYLSPEFLDDVRAVNQRATLLKLRASLTLASGWPYGGPQTPITEAAGAIRMVRTVVKPGERDAEVPHLANGEALLPAVLVAQDHEDAGPWKPLPLPQVSAARVPLPGATTGDSVLWFVSSRTGQQVKRPAVDADGFVLDHFSKSAIEDHLRQVADPLMQAFGNKPPYSVFSDSLEVYGADWTPDLLQDFARRRGYDLTPHLPELFSSQPTEEALEVRHDWGLTLTELIEENYLGPVEAWAKAHHTRFRSQTYGDPAVRLASNGLVDLPEGEGPQWQQFSYTRWATSASHIYGRNVTSAETWTWLHSPPFRATPLDMKAEADSFFLEGVNQLVGHGWPYSPPEAGEPGWRFYAAGAFNSHNPWWPVMPDVNSYLQRVSWALRQGEPASDVAVYLPEDDAYAAFVPGKVSISDLMPRWITPQLTTAIEGAGYGFDYLDGAAMAQKGIHARLLVMPNVDRIPLSALQQIVEYCKNGGKLIAVGHMPQQSAGMLHHASNSATVAGLVQTLLETRSADGSAAVRVVGSAAELGTAMAAMLPPDFKLDQAAPAVGFIHRKLSSGDIYFVANTGNAPVSTIAHFGSRFRYATAMDADTGEAAGLGETGHGVALELAPYGSQIFYLSADATNPKRHRTPSLQRIAELSHDWQLSFVDGTAQNLTELAPWDQDADKRYYSGLGTYRKSFELPAAAHGKTLLLSFGAGKPSPEAAASVGHPGMSAQYDAPVRDAAVVIVNGHRAGSLWHPPYTLDVTRWLTPGHNTIEVEVGNTAINEMAGEAQPDYRLLWARYGKRFAPQDMEGLKPLPSGLLGPVELLAGEPQ